MLSSVLLFKVRKDFEEQISRIITRIDRREDEMKTMKENLNINLGKQCDRRWV